MTVSDNYKGGVNRSTSMQVYLYIKDVNDNKPKFENSSYHAVVGEVRGLSFHGYRNLKF